ncbi:unnamed protein product [Echinostoma caproni]|uniref:Uncharacterized protein n=1 Tax=Echinostoma caproni TaxID=27848 RepID=A0A183BCB0_9TREM|nr:unnamed protein product [Echinostoma caproni]
MEPTEPVSDVLEAKLEPTEYLPSFEGDTKLPLVENTEVEETPEEAEERLKLREAIRRALDDQTSILYEQYAREQHPKDPQKVNTLPN